MSTGSYEIYSSIRDKLGYKDSAVAIGANVTKSTFSDWKAGRYQPKDEKLQKIASFLGVSIEYLKTGIEKEGGETYYLNDETKEIAQEIFKNPELKSLFELSRQIPPERLKIIIELFKQVINSSEPK